MLFDKKSFFLREHVAFFKLTGRYDILDPADGSMIGFVLDDPPSLFKFMRFFMPKRVLPTVVDVFEQEGRPPILKLVKGFNFLRAEFKVYDASGGFLGRLRSRLMTIGGRFDIFDAQNNPVAELKGNLVGWNFKFTDPTGGLMGVVTKKWAGIGRELFTTADNYMISLQENVSGRNIMALLLASGIAVDLVYKERKQN